MAANTGSVESETAPPSELAKRVGRVSAPLRQQVFEVLRDAILTFHYKPGQRLIERELIDEIGVSRTTIREVLRELTAEGLVRSIPQKGAVVVAPTPQDAIELYELRSALETLVVRRFVERASDSQVAELRAAFDQLDQVTSRGGRVLEVLRAKDACYDVLLRGCGNRSARSTLVSLHARVSLLRATSLSQEGRPARARDEIRAIVEAVEARDTEAAVRACTHHLEQAKQTGLAGLSASASLGL